MITLPIYIISLNFDASCRKQVAKTRRRIEARCLGFLSNILGLCGTGRIWKIVDLVSNLPFNCRLLPRTILPCDRRIFAAIKIRR